MGRLTLPEIKQDFENYFASNPAWGSLHIVLDDGNINDSSVKYCFEHARDVGDIEGARLAEVLLQLSKTQRLKLGKIGNDW